MNVATIRQERGEGVPVPNADDVDPQEVEASEAFWKRGVAKRLRPRETPAIVALNDALRRAYGAPEVDLPPVRGAYCRKWSGKTNVTEKGYGRPSDRRRLPKRRGYAHRWMWEAFYLRSIPTGYKVHHICNHPWCGEPLHLWALSRAEHEALHGRGRKHISDLKAGQPYP